MKNLEKVIVSIAVLGASLCCFGAKAEKITNVELLRQEVENAIINSREVCSRKSAPGKSGISVERKRAIVDVCSRRIDFLRNITAGSISKKNVMGIVGNYLGWCGAKPDQYEAVQLRKSGNPGDLRYNLEALIKAYELIRGKYSDFEAVEIVPDEPQHHHTQFLHTRSGRRQFQRGWH